LKIRAKIKATITVGGNLRLRPILYLFRFLVLFLALANFISCGGSSASTSNSGGDDLSGSGGGDDDDDIPDPTPSRCADYVQSFYYGMPATPISSPTTSYVEATTNKPIETYQPNFFAGTPTRYAISPAVPTGLSFSTSTGILSGTPTTTNLNGTTFTITVTYTTGGVTAKEACDFTYEVRNPNTSNTFTATGAMTSNRSDPVGVELASGNVLVVGGSASGNYLQTAEIYNSGTFTASAHTMSRYGAETATLLQDGTVLIAGGYTTAGGPTDNLTLEIYDPIADTFTLTGTSLGHRPKTAVLLNSGKVLFLEGYSDCTNVGALSAYAAQIFDPSDSSVSAAGFGGGSVANLLQDGTVLVRGIMGCLNDGIFGSYSNAYSATAAIYDPVGSSLTTTTGESYKFGNGVGPTPRTGIRLANGKVFFSDFYQSGTLNFFQLYDPASQTFSSTLRAGEADSGLPVKVLSGGEILLTAPGYYRVSSYDITGTTLTNPKALTIYTHDSTAASVLLQDGTVLMIGHGSGPSNAEYYTP
jgi:hypothetical protein